jgi:Arc/MetJ-type ribon-helix-helix transcriptional regulator
VEILEFVNTKVYYGDTMETVPAKMTKRLILELDKLIEEGWYSNRSEAVRDAVRELVEKKRIVMLEAAVREDIEWGLYGG